MTKLDALKALAEKVEAGDDQAVREFIVNDAGTFPPVWLGVGRIMEGSLDAAKPLHEAVLPDAPVDMVMTRGRSRVSVYSGGGAPFNGASFDGAARAWLLAILKALIWKEEK